MELTHKHITFNRLLATGNLLVICLFLVFTVWIKYFSENQADAINNEPIVLNINQPVPLDNASYSLSITRNVFDLSGKLWTIPQKKKAVASKKISTPMLKESDINGTMILPSFSGIFIDNQFIQSGSSIKGTKIENISDGEIHLKNPDGEKTYKFQKKGDEKIRFFKKTTL